MFTSPTLFFMAIYFLESLAAMLQNGIVVAMLGWEWVRSRALPAADMIVVFLATSRLGLHGMSVMNHLLVISDTTHKAHYINTIWGFSNKLNFWLNASLSVFYCMKITTFAHPAFLWLRWRLSRAVPRLLLGSLAISVLTTIPSVIRNTILAQVVVSQIPLTNSSWTDQAMTFPQKFFVLYEILVLLLPFLLFLVATALLMFSLHQHLHQMQGGWPRPGDPSTQTHTRALKSLGFFLVFYSSYFLSLIFAMMNLIPAHLYWYWAWQVVTYAGISLHSTILLLGSPRLRGGLKSRLQGHRLWGPRQRVGPS